MVSGADGEAGELMDLIIPLPDGTEMLAGVLANLTLRVALDGLSPAPPRVGDAIGGTFGPFRLDGFGGPLELYDAQLRVRVGPLSGGTPARRLVSLGQRLNQPVRLLLADGGEVVAELGHHTGTSTTFDAQRHVRTETIDLELDHWRYGPEPAAWVARLDEVEFEQGNLLVGRGTASAPRRWTHRNLRLQGNLTWHLVRCERGYSVIIEGGTALDTAKVHADLTALEFTLGARLNLRVLTGVNAEGAAVSAAAPIMARHESTRSRLPPVPPWVDRQAWIPRFFAAMSRALVRPDGIRFYVAINSYLDSLSESLDGAYLGLQVALEAFCRYANPPLPPLVADEARWRAWIDAHRAELELHATDARAAQRLLNKIRDAPKQRPSSDAVRAAFGAWKIDVPQAEMDELDGRHLAAHRYLMNESEAERDMERDVDRVAIVRTLLLAAIARTAGYGGPIHGWAGMRFGRPAWWSVNEDAAVAQRWYACLRPD